MKIAIYSRKSKLSDRGESIQNQIDMCKNYAQTHFNVSNNDVVIYEDEGYSGGNTDRPEFKRLLADAKHKKFDAVICYRLDRISRNVLDFSIILEALTKHKISFISITEHFDTTTPMGRAMVNIAAVFAQLERETIAERVRDNMSRLIRTGRYLGSTPPTGFASEKIDYIDHAGNKKKMQKLIPVEDEIAFIKLIYEKFIELEGLCKLETWLMKNEHKSKNGNYMGTTELRRMLNNPVYVKADKSVFDYYTNIGSDVVNAREDFNGTNGMFIYGRHDRHASSTDPKKWIVVIALHHGVIDSKDWLQAQIILEENKKRAPRSGTSLKGLLTSKIKCSDCGCTMVVYYGKNKNIHYYKCRNKIRSRKTTCDIKNIQGNKADQQIVDYLVELAHNDSELISTLTKNLAIEDENNLKFEAGNIEKKIKEREINIQNLTSRLRENNSSVVTKYIISDIEKLDSELQKLEVELFDIKKQISKVINLRNDIQTSINNILDFERLLPKLSFREKHEFINKIIDIIMWDGKEFTVRFR